jgi:hypothetical protein
MMEVQAQVCDRLEKMYNISCDVIINIEFATGLVSPSRFELLQCRETNERESEQILVQELRVFFDYKISLEQSKRGMLCYSNRGHFQ